MEVTLLGSGDALGVPAPLCDCRYCETSDRRRRPSLLVETEAATVVLDAGPELKDQLYRAGVTDVDAFFVTHHHFDHVAGVNDLNHAAIPFEDHMLDASAFDGSETPSATDIQVYMTPTAQLHLHYTSNHVADRLQPDHLEHGTAVEVGDLRVVPFPVDHGRPAFDTLGFAVEQNGAKVVYVPDMWEFTSDPQSDRTAGSTESDADRPDDGSDPDADRTDIGRDSGRAYEGADLLFAEGAALFRAAVHGDPADLRAALEAADADRTVLVNLNEHLQRMTTEAMAARASELGYELGVDFAEYEV